MAGNNCFLNGTRSDHVYEKIRNYVRTIEAFILPDTGKTTKQFKSRTEIFIGTGQHEIITELYEVRSAIEHLHDPLVKLNGESNKQKFTELLKLGITAEYMERNCIVRFIENHHLWDYFSSDEKIIQFWEMENAKKKELWGEPIELKKIEESFDANRVVYMEDPI